jgi:GMP synthase (glutamine-hydrolysing)
MMRIHFVIHEAFEAPGAYATWAEQHGYAITSTNIYKQEILPVTADGFDMLIVMGGPQSPATTPAECSYFHALDEQRLIRHAMNSSKAVVGVCLGAQLIGEALGASFLHSPEKEIGVYPITLTKDGLQHPLFAHFGKQMLVGHWHNDMPGLTDTATILAESEGCPHQIIEYASLVYGLQCHLEFTSEVVEQLIAHSQDDLARAVDYCFVQTPEQLRRHDYTEMNELLYGFLDKLVQEYHSRV